MNVLLMHIRLKLLQFSCEIVLSTVPNFKICDKAVMSQNTIEKTWWHVGNLNREMTTSHSNQLQSYQLKTRDQLTRTIKYTSEQKVFFSEVPFDVKITFSKLWSVNQVLAENHN